MIPSTLIAVSRPDAMLVNLFLPLAVGLLVAGVMTWVQVRRMSKRAGGKGSRDWQKFGLQAVFGMVIGYFMMKAAIKSNPGLFGLEPLPSADRLNSISSQPTGQSKLRLPTDRKPEVGDPSVRRQERERSAEEERERQYQKRVQRIREEHEDRADRFRSEREDRLAAEKELRQQDEVSLLALSVGELERIRDQRELELEQARVLLRSGTEDPETHQLRLQAVAQAVKAYQAAFRIHLQKQSELRESVR